MNEQKPKPLTAKYCHDCDATISRSATMCPHCGATQVLATRCPHCGGTQGSASRPSRGRGDRNRIAAAILAFFLGGLGAHKFYTGNPGVGILYLVFCLTMIPAFLALFDGIRFMSMSDNDFDVLYN